jgi:hypothetical protein
VAIISILHPLFFHNAPETGPEFRAGQLETSGKMIPEADHARGFSRATPPSDQVTDPYSSKNAKTKDFPQKPQHIVVTP